ncbi:Fic family protein [Spirosoma sordidisoli]|uniref:Cell filamentation protein Fic n=1 Tax=Spirosoma sordidisoli TaxID=2502893 RepID=A0A4Q2UCT4_9BACT|nr:Fic family protein [Spirosoma sordidisoli]RYC66953.1 cell filamentation protein Fic [Spirosoma sordidisoli]
MATPAEKLAQSLEALHSLQKIEKTVAIRTKDLTRTHRERLLKSGFLKEVLKGWYLASRPDERPGDTTGWYTSFWQFCASYLNERFDEQWVLSPEQSLALHSGNWVVPQQLLVRSPEANNNETKLLLGTSLFDIRVASPADDEVEVKEGLRIYALSAALVLCSPVYFIRSAMDARSALSLVRDTSDLLAILLRGGHTVVAGRLAGAFRNIGNDRLADDLIQTMRSAGYEVREEDPFTAKLPSILSFRESSPYVNRIRLLWQSMRETVLEHFPAAPGRPSNIDAYLKQVDDAFITDAYNSLSIEGYQVTPALIERVRQGQWNPDQVEADQDQKNALAARGYWQAHQAVKQTIKTILQGQNAGEAVENDHRIWYRELFAPSVSIGLLNASDLAGYRNGQVYIRGSKHVPLNRDAVRDVMPIFFELLQTESEPAVRVVLGHFIFVYIHPYMDGNGRIGRFLMNAMLASGGYPWTIVPLSERNNYMHALEKASVEQDITDFTIFLANLVKNNQEL